MIIVELITGLVLVLVIVELPKCKSAFRPISVRLQLTSRLVGLNIVVNVCLNIVVNVCLNGIWYVMANLDDIIS